MKPAASMEEGRDRIIALVDKFRRNREQYQSSDYSEALTRKEFIDPMLAALGWDVANTRGDNLFAQDSIPEMRLQMADRMKYLDYGQRIDGRHALSIEAKAAFNDIDKPKYKWQAHRYAWSSMRSEFAVLTNFTHFRAFDARVKPDWRNPSRGEISMFNMVYEQYPANWDLLWNTFSKDAVIKGSIKMVLNNSTVRVSVLLQTRH